MGREATGHLVLVVDDSEEDRMFVRDALRQVAPDVVVEELGDGVELLEYLRDGTRPLPDLVLLDLHMPRKDGLETLAEIRRDTGLAHVPVIAVFTTATDGELVRRAYSSGANAYIAKPSTMSGLRGIMAGLVQHWFTIVTLPGKAER